MTKSQIQYKCKDVVFHFNKKHLEDQTVPMWVLKTHGVTFYINHIDAKIPFSTKETPDNNHTKGSLKFKDCKLTIHDDNSATLDQLGVFDHNLPHPKESTRIITRDSSEMHMALDRNEFAHSAFKFVEGACSTEFVICDLLDKDEMLLAMLKYPNQFRLLSPNERYYIAYETESSIWVGDGDDDGFDYD